MTQRDLGTLHGLIGEKLEEIRAMAETIGVEFDRITFIALAQCEENPTFLITDSENAEELQESFDLAMKVAEGE